MILTEKWWMKAFAFASVSLLPLLLCCCCCCFAATTPSFRFALYLFVGLAQLR